jgi:selenide,water dikinase
MSRAAPRLTQYSSGGGCACKLPQSLLADVLAGLRHNGAMTGLDSDPDLLVGLDLPDDGAVYAIDEHRAWVVTCDFLTPVVDDPRDWGRIAAANALSDVYAMGGRPLLALNLLGWPEQLSTDLLGEVLRGGGEVTGSAGAILVGGHSIVDPVPKYGLVAVGEVDRSALLTKGGGGAGDVLVLTKPLGVGVVSTAIKRGEATQEQMDRAVESMTRLNANAAAVARAAGLRGGTDVTGYGLVGHLHEMAKAAELAALVFPEQVPRLPGLGDLLTAGCTPDGSRRTLENGVGQGWIDPGRTDWAEQLVLTDAQTSGGLLLAVPREQATEVLLQLRRRGDLDSTVVGELVPGRPGHVKLVAGEDR